MTKTLSFTVMHFAIAFSVTYLMTGSLVLGGAVALVEPAVNSVAFHFHEKLWRGREAEPAAEDGVQAAISF